VVAGGPQSAATIDPAKTGRVAGTVVLQGAAPPNAVISMHTDPECMKAALGRQTRETFVVGTGSGLENVFVYLQDGLGRYVFTAPSEPVTLDQSQCRYHPHVLGIRVGQPLAILNNDPTLHNIHARPEENREFNIGQPFKGMETVKKFDTPEVGLQFKCDVHKWMGAYAGVVNHPFFAVTGDQGTFEIKNLPAGSYVIEAWHEKYGAQTQNVTVAGSESKTVDFSFKG